VVYRALVKLPVDFIQRDAAHAFIDEVKPRELNHLLKGAERSLNMALNDVHELEAAKDATGTQARNEYSPYV
jgi:hypothetical protein